MTKVLIVDDSSVSRAAVRLALATDPEIAIVGEAEDQESTLAAIAAYQPDIVTMDVFLRRENGLDIARQIMGTSPRPVLILTSADTTDTGLVYRAMEAGALEVWSKPPSPRNAEYASYCRQLTRVVRALARVPVVHRRPARVRGEPTARFVQQRYERPQEQRTSPGQAAQTPSALLIGASTGGPPVVAELIRLLEPGFTLPIVVIQHMSSGFMQSFASWLEGVCGRKVNLVHSGAALNPGEVYIPDEARHLVLLPGLMVAATPEPADSLHRPSIDVTFHSAAQHLGPKAMAVLMTGMGKDGAAGLAALRAKSAVTIAQEPSTCIIDSMPRNAIELGAAVHIASPDALPELLRRCAAKG